MRYRNVRSAVFKMCSRNITKKVLDVTFYSRNSGDHHADQLCCLETPYPSHLDCNIKDSNQWSSVKMLRVGILMKLFN